MYMRLVRKLDDHLKTKVKQQCWLLVFVHDTNLLALPLFCLPFLLVPTKRCHHSLSPKADIHSSHFLWWPGKSWASSSLLVCAYSQNENFNAASATALLLQDFLLIHAKAINEAVLIRKKYSIRFSIKLQSCKPCLAVFISSNLCWLYKYACPCLGAKAKVKWYYRL